MRFVVIFEEGTEMVPVREAHEPAHLVYLEQHREEIRMAGGLRNQHGGPYVGGLWVFEVTSRERAVELIEQARTTERIHGSTAFSPGARLCRSTTFSCRPERAAWRLTLRCTRLATAGFARFRERVNSNVGRLGGSRPSEPSLTRVRW
jgi:hypothetical protein